MKTSRCLGAIALFLSTLNPQLSTLFAQGSLTPPGAPAPTMKTLDQVEPRIPIDAAHTPGDATSVFKITQPGSYYLTGNITGVSGKHGVYITTGNVTLDLMGFDLVGAAGSLDGIHVDNLAASINYAVRNGTVRNWGGYGLNLNVQGKHLVTNVRAFNNGQIGIACANDAFIEGCNAQGNGSIGIYAVAGTVSNSNARLNGSIGISAYVVTGCTASSNTGDGISSSDGAVTNCLCVVNTGAGIVGSFGTVITNCSTIANTGNGITLDEGSIAANCYARGNAIGISATAGSRIGGCSTKGNDGAGISTGDGCLIEHSVAYSNGLVTPAAGITVGVGCTINSCVSSANTAEGILTSTSATVADCNAEGNQGTFGIRVSGESVVRHCVAFANTSAATSSGGISLSVSCLAVDCIASNNTSTAGSLTGSTGMGISISSGSTVRHCTVRANTGDGIRAVSNCAIEGNTANSNGNGSGDGAGVHITSSDCRIEGNNATDNDRGIDVDLAGCLIIRNSASGNTSNYEIAAGNAVGAIVVTAASVAISGSGPIASSLTSTDPWANFSY